MSELSPAAQAVDRAIADRIQLLGEIAPSRQIAAAALRAANAQIPPLRYAADYIEHLLAIAAELEGQALPQLPTQPTTEEP